MSVALTSAVTPSGFGYPPDAFSPRQTLGSLFQLPTLLGFAPSELSSVEESRKSFLPRPPLLRFPTKPFQASYRRSSGFPLLDSGLAAWNQVLPSIPAASALLRFTASQVLLLNAQRKASPFPFALSPFPSPPLSRKKSEALGLLSSRLGSPPSPRAPTCLTFSTDHSLPHPWVRGLAAAYFFSSGYPAPYETRFSRLCSQSHPA